MKAKMMLLAVIAVFFIVSAKAQTQHTIRNQYDKNVLLEVPSAGIREYLGPVNSGSNTSTHLFYSSSLYMKITVDYKEPVELSVNLDGEYIDINQDLLDQGNHLTTSVNVEEEDYKLPSENKKQMSSTNSAKSILFINTTDYKLVGKTGAVKGLTLMPGDSIDDNIIRLNKALRYNIFEGNYIDNRGTTIKKENANKLLGLYNSNAKIRWLNSGSYEENLKFYLTETGERDKVGALLVLQFKVDDETNYIIIDDEDIEKNMPHGEKRERDIINKSDSKLQLTIGGTQKVVPAKNGRRFSKVQMEEELANGLYYLTVVLITDKAIQRDVLLMISEDQKHFIFNQNIIDQLEYTDYEGQLINK